MKTIAQTETADKKRERLSNELPELASLWPYPAKTQWAIDNGINHETVNRYLRGEIGSLITGQAIRDEVIKYCNENAIELPKSVM